MQVIKRNGTKIDFNPNKILLRIKKQSDGLKVNPDEVFLKVTQGIADNMTTNEVDDLISIVAESLSMNHPDYSTLAANIAISKLHKETEDSFMKATKKQYNAGLLNENYYNKVKENIELIESVINYKRDFNFDYFGWCSLKDIYLLKTRDGQLVERPQQMYVRVALMITNTPADFIEKYYDLSNQLESPATPIKINIGTKIGQIASCNLSIVPDDSTEGLLEMLGRISISSSKAEGIGLAVSNIRSRQTNVGNSDGKAGGIFKYLKVINEALRFWNQRGKRPGSCAIYIEPWHKDIFDVLDMRKKTGDETLRARDLFSALWIPDNFMRAVEENGDWYLFCPQDIKKAGLKPFYEIYGDEYEEEYNKAVEMGIGTKIKAHDLWLKILEAQIETGMPYMCFKDAANKKSNQKNMGVIHSSNLCVAGDTMIKTRHQGIEVELPISYVILLKEQGFSGDIEVLSYNTETKMEEYKKITNWALMNTSAEVLKITDEETGKSITCTPEHQIYTKNRGYVLAKDLVEDDILEIK